MSSTHSHLDHAHDPNALHRFAHPSPNAYYQLTPHSQPALEPLSNQVPLPSYSSRHQPWLLNVQTTYPHHNQPNTLPDRPGFYSPAGPDSQLVGYPESSQRTLLHDASYASLYTMPYATSGPSFSYQNAYPASASGPSDELQGALDSQNIARSSYRAVQGLSERRTAPYTLSSHYLDGRGDLYGPGGPAPLPANSSSAALAQLGRSPPSYAVSHPYGMGSPTSTYPHITSDATPIMDVHSPRSGAYPVPIRRDSMDSLPDPISPSSVPGLVFDGDDYDDDSESSLPSAASEVQRLPYRPPAQAGSDDRDYDPATGRDWNRTSLEGQYGAPGASAVALDEGVRQQARSPEPSPDAEPVTPEGPQAERARPPQKKSKMHQCTVCYKLFPRPSGLATHMNSHSGAKPFKCPIPTCTKSFAVRSNAKRHLRTHGIFPSAEHGSTSPSQFTVGFDTPLVSEVHEAGKLPSKLRWVPPSLATRSNIDYLRDAASDSEDEYFQPSCPLLPLPLPPVAPSSPTQWGPEDRYAEERNSYEQADSAPYISSQWRALPGPAIASPTGFN